MEGIRSAGEYNLTDLKLFTGSGEVINLDLNYLLYRRHSSKKIVLLLKYYS